jgi:hypothetical protein
MTDSFHGRHLAEVHQAECVCTQMIEGMYE